METKVTVLFGREIVAKVYSNEELSQEEVSIYKKEFRFQTPQEKDAFIEGLNAAIGYSDFCIPELEFNSIRG